jgi:hypothetical protein
MELNRKRRDCNWLNLKSLNGGQGRSRTADTRIFSPLAVAGLCDTIGRYWYLFKRLTAVSAGRFYRFEHIAADSSFKALSKQRAISRPARFFFDNGRCMFCPGSGTERAHPRTQGSALILPAPLRILISQKADLYITS